MNKKWTTILVAVVIATNVVFVTNNNTAVAYQSEEASYFSVVSNYWDTTYHVPHFDANGGWIWMEGNVKLSNLPYGMMDEGAIYTICCYNNKIYYSTGMGDGDIDVPTKIYSCDMNGQNNVLLADNAVAYNDAIIIDNVLYYQEYAPHTSGGMKGYNGGISKINLDDLSWQKLVDGNASMNYCDGEYVYYVNNNNGMYCAIDVNGQNVIEMSPWIDEYCSIGSHQGEGHFIKDDKMYYIDGNILYAKELNQWKQEIIGITPYNSQVINVSNNYIYYVTMKSQYSNGTYMKNPTATVYRVHR